MINKKLLIITTLIAGLHFSQAVRAQTNPATLTLIPGTSNITPASQKTIDLVLNTGSHLINSVQIVASVTGSAAQNSIVITPRTVTGLNLTYSDVSNITNGKQFVYIYTIPSPTAPFSTNDLNLLTIQFTAPASGQENITFDPVNTLVEKSDGSGGVIQVNQNPANAVYTVQAAAPTLTQPAPSATPTPEPSNTPIPTQPPANISAAFQFRLQGITTAIGPQDATFKLKNPVSLALIKLATASAAPDNTGLHTTSFINFPISSTGVTPIRICLKAKSHLQSCFNKNLTPADNGTTIDLNSTDVDGGLLAGDVDDNNKIDISDWGLVQASRTSYIDPVTPNNISTDINNDLRITIDDASLTFFNITNFEILGED